MYSTNPAGWWFITILFCIPAAAIGAGIGALCLEGTKLQGAKSMNTTTWIATAIWALICLWFFSLTQGDGSMLRVGLLLSPLVTAGFALLGASFQRSFIRLKLRTAQKLLAQEGAVLSVLDQDSDSIVSPSDILRATPLVLGKPFTQPELDLLSSSMSDFGHDIGSEQQHFFIISRSDLVNLEARLKETYKNWRSDWPDNW